MKVVKDTPFELGVSPLALRAPQWALCVVVKATFGLAHAEPMRVAEAQRPLEGDLYADDDVTRELLYGLDQGYPKPRGECLVRGLCHRPRSGPEGFSGVAFRAGSVQKSAAVFGARRWARRLGVWVPSEPEAFSEMPLTWDRAWGGPDVRDNPVGVGSVPAGVDPARVPLPTIERPEQLLQSPDQRVTPWGLGPVSPRWFQRQRRLASSPSQGGAAGRQFLPSGFDYDYFHSAPSDQWAPGFWRGDEEIALRHLRPEQALIQTRLPGVAPRVVATLSGREHLVAMHCDTLFIDAEAGEVVALWRGLVPVRDAKASDVSALFVCHEGLSEGRTLDALTVRRAAVLAEAEGEAVEAPPGGFVRPPLPTVPGVAVAGFAAALAGGAVLASRDLSALSSPGADLSGRDLSGAVLNGADLSGANLSGASLKNAVLCNAKLGGANLSGVDLRGADLTGADLEGATLVDVQAEGVVAEGLVAANTLMTRCNFSGSDLQHADLTRAVLQEVVLDRVECSQVTFVEARFEGCSLRDTTVDGADLTRAVFVASRLDKLRASGAPVTLTGANLRGAPLRGARLMGARLDDAELSDAVLVDSDLDRAVLDGARLVGANLQGVTLREASLARTTLTSANLMNAVFDGAELRQTDLRGANLFGASADGVRVGEALLQGARVERSGFAGGAS
ncbi:MAG: DUF2169 domain-containing protein [Myxococcales bacterium]|nr:DUF2169 domain-containing protein [Myxococcales bacterium]